MMKAAGLTHGAFYAHFGSKEALQVAAVAYGQKVSLERVQRSKSKKGKGSYANRYLSRCHRDNPGDGCTMAALAQEVARASLHISIRVALTHFLRQKGPRTRHGPDEHTCSVRPVVLEAQVGLRELSCTACIRRIQALRI